MTTITATTIDDRLARELIDAMVEAVDTYRSVEVARLTAVLHQLGLGDQFREELRLNYHGGTQCDGCREDDHRIEGLCVELDEVKDERNALSDQVSKLEDEVEKARTQPKSCANCQSDTKPKEGGQ